MNLTKARLQKIIRNNNKQTRKKYKKHPLKRLLQRWRQKNQIDLLKQA